VPGRRLLLTLLAVVAGCGTIRGVRAIEDLDASLVRVTGVRLGGIRVELSPGGEMPVVGMMVVGARALTGRVPFACDAIVRLENPATNRATAELLRSRWTLRLGARDLAAGTLDERHSIPPGRSVEVPVHIALDLADVLGRDPGKLLDFAAALAGDRRRRLDVSLRLVPILDTPLGGVPLPPITIPLA
jgi:hypothetical protein